MRENIIIIPSNQVLAAGKSMGIVQNTLSRLSGFPDENINVSAKEEWKDVLHTLLVPRKFIRLITSGKDNTLESMNLACNEDKILLYNSTEEGDTLIQIEERSKLENKLSLLIGNQATVRDISLPMTLDGLMTLSAISDIIKMQKLKNMLDSSYEMLPPRINEIQKIIEDSEEKMDPRWWLTPFISYIYGLNRKVNVYDGLMPLLEMKIIEAQEGVVYPTESGLAFLKDLSDRQGIIGMGSYYFKENKSLKNTIVILRTSDQIWYFQCGENSILSSVGHDEAKDIIKKELMPGDDVPQEDRQNYTLNKHEINKEIKTTDSRKWVCQCGKENISNFCGVCGKSKSEGSQQKARSKFCMNCGTELREDAQFCGNCGAKVKIDALIP